MVQENNPIAKAKVLSAPISTKHSVEISRALRFKSTTHAKSFLEQVVALKKAVAFKRYTRDVGHKTGIGAGRYPQKAAKVFLDLLKNVEANAAHQGLNPASLKITKLVANKAAIPASPGRRRYQTKRTHLEIEVKEAENKKSAAKKKESKTTTTSEGEKQ